MAKPRSDSSGIEFLGRRLLGRFDVVARIGGGGESVVYRGVDGASGEPVALKVWLDDDDEASDRLAEWRVLADTSHVGIVPIKMVAPDPDTGRLVLVMDLLEGSELTEAYGDLDDADRERLVCALVEAVAYLHRHGLLHGDLKPGNILVVEGPEGPTPVLIDFGMATSLHQTRFMGGTPAYLAPEVASGLLPDSRADLYSLGVTILQAELGDAYPRRTVPSDHQLPPWLGTWLPRLLRRDPDRRPADADTLAAILRRDRSESLAVPSRLPFAGRNRQMARILEVASPSRVRTEGPTVISVSGAPGTGRHRLIFESLLRLQAEGLRTISLAPPYDLAAILEETLVACGRSSDEARRLGREALRLSAEPSSPMPPPTGNRAAAIVHDALSEDLLVLAATRMDDLPADVLAFLESLVAQERAQRGDRPQRILVLVSGRTAGLDPDLDIPMTSLSPAATRRILVELTGLPGSTTAVLELAQEVHELTGGLPLLVDDLLRQAARQGTVRRTEDRLAVDWPRLREYRPLTDTSLVLERRLDEITSSARAVLHALAAAYEQAAATDIRVVVGTLGPKEVEAALDELLAAELIVVGRGRGELRYGPASEVHRRLALQQQTTDVIRGLHRRWASVARGPDRVLHRVAAADGAVGRDIPGAVDAFLARGDAVRAITLCETAVSTGVANPDETPKLMLVLARLHFLHGAVDEAERALRSLMESPLASVASAAARGAVETSHARGRATDAARHADTALRRAGGDGGLRSLALATLASVKLRAGDAKAARAAAREAISLTQPDSYESAVTHNIVGLVELRSGHYERARDELEQAAAVLARRGDPFAEAVALLNLGVVLLRLERTDAARGLLQDLSARFRLNGCQGHRARALTNLGVLENAQGNAAYAARHQKEAHRLALAAGDQAVALLAKANEGISLFDGGWPTRAFSVLRGVLPDLEATGQKRASIVARAHLARTAATIGRLGSARRHADRALRTARALGTSREIIECLLAVGEVLGVDPRASRWLERGRRWARRHGETALRREATLLLARSRIEHGDGEGSRTLLEEWTASSPGAESAADPSAVLVGIRLQRDSRSLIVRGLRRAFQKEHGLASMVLSFRAAAIALSREPPRGARRAFQRGLQQLERLEDGMSERARSLFEITDFSREVRELARLTELRLASMERGREGLESVELAEILQVLTGLGAASSMQELLESVVDSALRLSGAHHGYVVLQERKRDELVFAAARSREGRKPAVSSSRMSTSIAAEVIATGRSLVIADAQSDDRYRGLFSVARHRVRALVCTPLRTARTSVGALYLDSGTEPGLFREKDVPLIEAFANLAALIISHHREIRDTETARSTLESKLKSERTERLAELRELRRARPEGEIIGKSASIESLRDLVAKAASSDIPVLVSGESGTGKEIVVQAIHAASGRRSGPLVVQNCAALPIRLIESELFGYRKGAFSGATADHPGVFLLADQGTLFLDGVNELSLPAQAKLLRALEQGQVRPLGSASPVEFDVRIIASTNRDLQEQVAQGHFREDLYYRIKVIEVAVPPLRERREDIPDLARHFIQLSGTDHKLSKSAVQLLKRYAWPGNVRELRNEIERAVALSTGPRIGPEVLSEFVKAELPEPPSTVLSNGRPCTLEEVERRSLHYALQFCQGDRKRTAAMLGISRSTLYKKLDRDGV